VGGQELHNIWVMGELLQHQPNRDAGAPDHQLSPQDPWVGDNAFLVWPLLFFHLPLIIPKFSLTLP
jgi:hypothetical protein